MPSAKSQWDFGELFPVQKTRKVWSVAELTWKIRSLLEQQLGQIWVVGEITNLKSQPSGHIYFTLKDAVAQISCVLFRGELQVDRSLLQDGRKINVRGEVTVYEQRGQYQLRVVQIELQGVGALQAAFERLKQKLAAEGLWAFNEEIVARAIFQSALPIVSAVGHETDVTISDFVADFRAATPTAAAELLTEGVFSSCQFVAEAARKIRSLLRRQVSQKQ